MEKPITRAEALRSLEINGIIHFPTFDKPELTRSSILVSAKVISKKLEGFKIKTKMGEGYVEVTRVG